MKNFQISAKNSICKESFLIDWLQLFNARNLNRRYFAHLWDIKAFLIEEAYISLTIYHKNGVHFGSEKNEANSRLTTGVRAELQGDS